MASELQRQVKRHKEKSCITNPIHKGRPSLFLSAKDAASVDVTVIYKKAISGLTTLSQYDSRFDKYFGTLLLEEQLNTHRELLTASVCMSCQIVILTTKFDNIGK